MKILACCLLFLVFATPAHAQKPDTKAALESLKKDEAALKREAVKLQEQSTKQAANVRKLEQRLQMLEQSLAKIRREREAAEQRVQQGKAKLSGYTHAMLRLSDVPPEAMLLVPELGNTHMEAAAALKLMGESIRKESAAVNAALERAKQLEAEEAKQTEQLKTTLAEEKKDTAELQATLEQKQRALSTNSAEQAKLEAEAKRAAKASTSTKELISKLPPKAKASQASLKEAKKGAFKAPVAGRIIKQFGEMSTRGDKGILYDTRKQAVVTAPYGGEVVFAAPFMNYGIMVIIRHKGDVHSVLSGMASLNTKLGEILLEGEPIGAMGDDSGTQQLYFEVRRGNQAVNPADWL